MENTIFCISISRSAILSSSAHHNCELRTHTFVADKTPWRTATAARSRCNDKWLNYQLHTICERSVRLSKQHSFGRLAEHVKVDQMAWQKSTTIKWQIVFAWLFENVRDGPRYGPRLFIIGRQIPLYMRFRDCALVQPVGNSQSRILRTVASFHITHHFSSEFCALVWLLFLFCLFVRNFIHCQLPRTPSNNSQD